jgi:polar amino acid transport system permease protein
MSQRDSDRMAEVEPGSRPGTGRGRDADEAPPEAIIAIPLRHPGGTWLPCSW